MQPNSALNSVRPPSTISPLRVGGAYNVRLFVRLRWDAEGTSLVSCEYDVYRQTCYSIKPRVGPWLGAASIVPRGGAGRVTRHNQLQI